MVRARVHRVELVERDLLERVVLVDEKADGVERAVMTVRAAGNGNAQRVVAELVLEAFDVVGLELARDKDKVEVSFHELDRAQAAGVRRRDAERDAGMVALEFLEPLLHQDHHHVRRGTFEAARELVLARLVRRKRRIQHRLQNLRGRQLAANLSTGLRFLGRLRLVRGEGRDKPFDHRPIDRLCEGACCNAEGAGP